MPIVPREYARLIRDTKQLRESVQCKNLCGNKKELSERDVVAPDERSYGKRIENVLREYFLLRT
jgi:hypothetical protein